MHRPVNYRGILYMYKMWPDALSATSTHIPYTRNYGYIFMTARVTTAPRFLVATTVTIGCRTVLKYKLMQ